MRINVNLFKEYLIICNYIITVKIEVVNNRAYSYSFKILNICY